eukprot:7503206-Heterocapsa_arctica.AAC.1
MVDAADYPFEIFPLFELSEPLVLVLPQKKVSPDFAGLRGWLLEGTICPRQGPPISLDPSPSQG